ncbi:MAG: T9SS type A sorting domain-containing protein [Ignavibacteria bacterium]|nr:T9SS type A sorting domain-containing protein [Ignavibacteria bacterium]
MYSQLGRTTITPELAEHPLATATIIGWHAKGYSTWTQERSGFVGTLGSIIDTTKLLSRHPLRYNRTAAAGGAPGAIGWEPKDSMFADIGVFAVNNPSPAGGFLPTNSTFLLTVSNRRTDSRMLAAGLPYTADTAAVWSFVDNDQYNARVAADANQMFMQRGSRQILIPFKFAHADGRYRLLRIRELGGGINTVVGQDRELAVNFLPGQGRFFRVEVLASDDAVRTNPQDVGRGFLDHNTQRKIVHFPQVTGWALHTEPKPALGDTTPGCTTRQYSRTINGTTMRYHMVYHRRTNPDLPFAAGNRLDVFYQRSAPMPIRCNDETNCADLGSVVWEAPITLNSYIVESEVYNEVEQKTDTVLINPINRPSCAYPSVVVRYDPTAQRSRVYVVYACEEDNPATPQDITIYEAQLDADAVAPRQADDYKTATGRSFKLDTVTSNPYCPANQRLRNWGTPVVNASYLGNYYAWSDFTRGIVYAHKVPTERKMTQADRKNVKIITDSGAVAQFPTLNTYSRLHIGEDECALAWQEGHYQASCTEGEKIYYTQLSLEPGLMQARRGLHTTGAFVNLSTLPTYSYDAARQEYTVALVSDAGGFNSKPSLLRTLSDYDQAGFTDSSTVQSYIGGSRHKADRLFWTRQYPLVTTSIARRPIDVIERAPCTDQDLGQLWSGPVGYIYGQTNLSNPEISLGESKTVLLGTPAAQSWAYDDTCYVLNFNQATANPLSPAIWHTAFGWRLMGQGAPTTVDLAYGLMDLKTFAYVHKNSINGRNPHSSTTYSYTLAFGLTKGRRVFEQPPYIDFNWNQAPTMWRSAEGFYKGEASAKVEGSSRVFVGFRAADFDAMLAQTVIDDAEGFMLRQFPKTENAVGQTMLVSDWQQLPPSFDLSQPTVSDGQAYDNAHVYLERQSDLERLELPVFENTQGLQSASERTREHSWKTFADTKEFYRLVVECTHEGAEIATDIELEPLPVGVRQAKAQAIPRVLDLRTMKTIEASGFGMAENTIEVIPQPASELVTVLISAGSGGSLAAAESAVSNLVVTDLEGREVLRTPIKLSTAALTIADLNVSTLPVGVYNVSVGTTNTRTLMRIAR